VLTGLDRVVLRRQPEGVVAHRLQDPPARAPVEVGHGISDGVDLQVADVRLARGVGQHHEHIGLVPVVRLAVDDLPGLLLGPHRLPARLDLLGVIAVLGHPEQEHRVCSRASSVPGGGVPAVPPDAWRPGSPDPLGWRAGDLARGAGRVPLRAPRRPGWRAPSHCYHAATQGL
jgi:hypothetical protein